MVDVSGASPAITLDYAKAQLRVEHDLDDLLIESYILSATMLAEHRMHRPIIARDADVNDGTSEDSPETVSGGLPCDDACDVPAPIRQWIALTVGYWYSHRELAADVTAQPLPFGDNLLDPWRLYE